MATAVARSSVNLPNALTLGRLLAVPLFVLLLVNDDGSPGGRLLLAAVYVGACLTDLVDGHLARSRDQVTRFGIQADPIADKALVGAALIGLSVLGDLPWWATVVILGREVVVTGLRLVVRRHGLIPASCGGKLKSLTQNTAVTLYLLPLTGLLADVRLPVLVVAVAATVLTGADYAAQAARMRAAASARAVVV
ncbi:hypothetical protein BH20ACT6_BH20ACT6_24110 [soil metagenome]